MRPATALSVLVLSGCAAQARVDDFEAGLSVCAKGPVVDGVDVSHYEGAITWPSVKAGGFVFAIMKATEQTGFVDPTFAANWQGAGQAGIIRGAYHFFRPSYDPIQQADFFLAQAGVPAAGDLPPAIDLEATDSLSGAQVAAGALAFLQRVEQKSGRKPIIYSSARFFTSIGDPAGFGSYPLWVANWQVTCPKIPSPEWSDWAIWQHSATGSVPGISGNVDVNQFNGTLDDLHQFVGSGSSAVDGGGAPAGDDAGSAGGDDAGDTGGVGSGGGGAPMPPMQNGCAMGGTSVPGGWLWLGVALVVLVRRRSPMDRRRPQLIYR